MTSQKNDQRRLILIFALILGLTPWATASGQLESRRNQSTKARTASSVAYGFNQSRTVSRSFIPSHQRVSGRVVSYQEPMAGDVIVEPITDGAIHMDSMGHSVTMGHSVAMGHTAGCESCGLEVACGVDWTGQCDSCNVGGCGDCGSCNSCAARGCLIPCPQFALRNMEYFGGIQGFKGAPNRGRDGSFGFNAGVNWGFDLPCLTNDLVSAQLGVRSVQSNFYESQLTTEQRDQLFVTAGLFRRVDYGLQGGVVADILYDDWYTNMNVAQLRGQLSWLYEGGNEFGFTFMKSIQDDTNPIVLATNQPANNVETWQALEQYRFFYTQQLDCYSPGATGTIFGGVSSDSDGMLGSDFWFPVSDCWALSTGFMYLIPNDQTGVNGNINEAWNIGINLTFYPSGLGIYRQRYNRPMFNVADNGTFLIDR